jgi:hypothetical protein
MERNAAIMSLANLLANAFSAQPDIDIETKIVAMEEAIRANFKDSKQMEVKALNMALGHKE